MGREGSGREERELMGSETKVRMNEKKTRSAHSSIEPANSRAEQSVEQIELSCSRLLN